MFIDAFITFPVLETDRLILRRLAQDDANALREYARDPDLLQFTDFPDDYSENIPQVIELWNKEAYQPNGIIMWCIALKSNNTCVGKVYLFEAKGDDKSGRRMDIGYDVSPEHRNKGYAREAIQRILRYGFEQMGLIRIQAQIMPNNTASLNAVKKCGFVNEGTLRNYCHYMYKGSMRDVVMMACTPEDIH